jgi:hypothetical protein
MGNNGLKCVDWTGAASGGAQLTEYVSFPRIRDMKGDAEYFYNWEIRFLRNRFVVQ